MPKNKDEKYMFEKKDDILGRYFGMILRYFGIKIKETNFLLVQNSFFFSVKSINNFSSQNIIPKDMEHVFVFNHFLINDRKFWMDILRQPQP